MSSPRSLRDRVRRLGWAIGLPGLALVGGVVSALVTPRVEEGLTSAAGVIAAQTAEAGAEPWLRFEIRGRDLLATGEAPDQVSRGAALSRLAQLVGLRRLTDRSSLVEEASPFVWTASRDASGHIDLAGDRPAEIGRAALGAGLAPALPPETTVRDRARAARGAPPDFLAASAYAIARLKSLAPGAMARIEDTTLSFSGEAASVAAYDALRTALANPPEGYTTRDLDILPPSVGEFRFAVTRERGGGLVLSGYAVSEALRDQIRNIATEAAEGRSVDDRMQTARGLPAGVDPAALTAFAFRVLNLMQDGTVNLTDSRLSVVGAAVDGQAVGEIETLIRDGRPTGIGQGTVTLETRPLSPYRLLVRRDGESVTLSGHLPDEAARERLIAAVRPRFFRERIVDKVRIAQGAPAALSDAVETAIGSLSLLATGEIRITDRALRLTGESLYRENARQIETTLVRRMPAGWQAGVAVRGPEPVATKDPSTCTASFEAALHGRPLQFAPGSRTMRPEFYPLLDALALFAKTCPSNRIEVTGHADTAGAAPVPKPALDGTVESTASVDAAKPAVQTPAPAPAGKDAAGIPAKPTAPKAPATKSSDGKGASKDKSAKAEVKPEPAAEPEPDLARQRATAIVEYLLQAGLPADRVTPAPIGRSTPAIQGVGFALRP